jgi:hypothetical protein
METSSIAAANMAINEARKDIVNDMIWDHDDKLKATTVECEKREFELLGIQTHMSSKQSQVVAMTEEHFRLKKGSGTLRSQLVVFEILCFLIVMLL